MTMKDKDLVKLLEKNGWKLVRVKGSHHILKKDGKKLSIPVHGKDMKIGLLKSLLKAAGLD